ncbi:MAG: hypothetical protein AAF655_24215 [Bacteroidota bacterium]
MWLYIIAAMYVNFAVYHLGAQEVYVCNGARAILSHVEVQKTAYNCKL